MFLRLAAVAATGGVGAIGTAVFATVSSWHAGHFNSAFAFFGLWGIVALAGAAANIAVYFQTGDPPSKPPRGGARVVPLRSLDARPKSVENERRAA